MFLAIVFIMVKVEHNLQDLLSALVTVTETQHRNAMR